MFKLMHNIVISIILLLFIFLIIWSIFIEPNQIEIKYYEIQDSQLKGTKIVFAGDFHFKKHQQKRADKIISLINQQNADLVLSTGDYINSHKESASMSVSQIAENIGKIRPKVYTSLGNHDFWAGNEKITKEFKKHNITVLSNSNAKIKIKDKIIYIAGVEDLQTGNPDVEKALENTQSPRILLTHSPDIFPDIRQKNINLILAGHLHGGQIRIPLIGAIIVPSKYGNKYSKGLIIDNHKKMIVTKGIGTSILPVRFNCKPDFIVIDFI